MLNFKLVTVHQIDHDEDNAAWPALLLLYVRTLYLCLKKVVQRYDDYVHNTQCPRVYSHIYTNIE